MDNPLSKMTDGGLDTAKVAGIFVLGALLVLGATRKGFAGVRVNLGD